jgi:flagellar basal-body rod modification protein FlgD
MQIHSVSFPISHASTLTTPPAGARGASATATSSPVGDTNSMFMKLLTAQLQNQSPLDPVDPMQFTSQLVQFNMLDQLTQINAVLQQEVSSASTGASRAIVKNSGGN